MPTNRSFGLLFAAVFLAGAAWCAFHNEWILAALFLCLGGVAAALALFFSETLAPFNKAWFFLGQFLGKIVQPVVLGVFFYAIFVPIGVVSRVFGRDVLRLKSGNKTSYWIDREQVSLGAESFKNQF